MTNQRPATKILTNGITWREIQFEFWTNKRTIRFPFASLYKGQAAECLWSCSWREHPYYRRNMTHTMARTNGSKENVLMYINIYKIPENLSCMDTCVMVIPAQCNLKEKLDCYIQRLSRSPHFTALRWFAAVDYLDIKAMTCYLANLDTSLYPGQTCNIPGT